MDSPSVITTAQKLFELVIPKLNELNIPPTAKNYTVWYEYFSDGNPELNTEIAELIASGTTFTDSIHDRLIEQHINTSYEARLDHMRSAIKVLIDQLSNQLTGFSSEMEQYESALDACEQELISTADADVAKLKQLITRLLGETQTARQNNHQLLQTVSELTQEVDVLRNEVEQLSQQATTDPLTGLDNRRELETRLLELFENSDSAAATFALLVIDIDHFKNVNDQHGHVVGDQVLRFIAGVIKNSIKGSDIAARFGGEEFVVALPDTNLNGGMAVAHHIAGTLASKTLVTSGGKRSLGKITLSIGVGCKRADDDLNSLIERVDKCLYIAKSSGRACVKSELDLK